MQGKSFNMEPSIQLNLLDKSQPERVKRLQYLLKNTIFEQEIAQHYKIMEDIILELQNQEVRSFHQYNIKFLIDYFKKFNGFSYSTAKNDDYFINNKNPYIVAVLLAFSNNIKMLKKILINCDLDDLDSPESRSFHPRFIINDQNTNEYGQDDIIMPKSPQSQSPILSCLYILYKSKLAEISDTMVEYLGERIQKFIGHDPLSQFILKDGNMSYLGYFKFKQFVKEEQDTSYQLAYAKTYSQKLNELNNTIDNANKNFAEMQKELIKLDKLFDKKTITSLEYENFI